MNNFSEIESVVGRTFTAEERERILGYQAGTALIQRLVDARRDYMTAVFQADHEGTRKAGEAVDELQGMVREAIANHKP